MLATSRIRRGWGMQEVIVVVVVVALALLVLIPWILARREEARRTFCEKRQIDLARGLLAYEQVQQKFPGYRNEMAVDAQGVPRPTGWVFPMLSYLDLDEKGVPRNPEYRELVRAFGPEADANRRGTAPQHYLAALVCPDDVPDETQLVARPNWLNFVANCGQPDAAAKPPIPPDWPASGVFFNHFQPDGVVVVPMTLAAITQGDGSDHTLALSENLDAGQWTDSREPQVGFLWAIGSEADLAAGKTICRINQLAGEGDGTHRFARPSSRHSGGVNAVFVSGRSMFLQDEIDVIVYVQMMTNDGKNVKVAGRDEPAPPPFRE